MRYSYFATKQETFPSNPISLFMHTLMFREKERFREAECESKTLVNQCSNIDTCKDISPIIHENYFRRNKAVNTGTIGFLKFSRGMEGNIDLKWVNRVKPDRLFEDLAMARTV